MRQVKFKGLGELENIVNSRKYRRIVVKIGSKCLTRETAIQQYAHFGVAFILTNWRAVPKPWKEIILAHHPGACFKPQRPQASPLRIDMFSSRQRSSRPSDRSNCSTTTRPFQRIRGITCGQVLTTKESLLHAAAVPQPAQLHGGDARRRRHPDRQRKRDTISVAGTDVHRQRAFGLVAAMSAARRSSSEQHRRYLRRFARPTCVAGHPPRCPGPRPLSQYIELMARSSRGRGGTDDQKPHLLPRERRGIGGDRQRPPRQHPHRSRADWQRCHLHAPKRPRTASGVKNGSPAAKALPKEPLHLDAGAAAAVSQSKAASILAVRHHRHQAAISNAMTSCILSPEGTQSWAVQRGRIDSATVRRNLKAEKDSNH